MIDEIEKSSYQGGQSADYFAKLLPDKTEYVFQTLGAILEELEREITLSKQWVMADDEINEFNEKRVVVK